MVFLNFYSTFLQIHGYMDPIQKLPVVKMIDIVPLESADAEGVIHAI